MKNKSAFFHSDAIPVLSGMNLCFQYFANNTDTANVVSSR